MSEPVSSWRRLAAETIDGLVIVPQHMLQRWTKRPKSSVRMNAANFTTRYIYDIVSHRFFGASVGERIVGIRLVSNTGSPPSLRQICVRTFLKRPPLALLPSRNTQAKRDRNEAMSQALKQRMQELEAAAEEAERTGEEFDFSGAVKSWNKEHKQGRQILWRMAPELAYEAANTASRWTSPTRQAVYDRAAGVTLVRR